MTSASRVANLHERQRQATREALRAAALTRFRARGFADTSVAEIAGDAGVSERTFYRHFPSKEAVLFEDYAERLSWIRDALGRRPARESIFDAVLAAVRFYSDDTDTARQSALLRRDLVGRERLSEHLQRVHAGFTDMIAVEVRRRIGDRPDADLLAATAANAIAGALVGAFEVWGDRGATDDVSQLCGAAFDYLRAGLRDVDPAHP